MPEKIIQLNEGIIKEELSEMVRQSVEDTWVPAKISDKLLRVGRKD